jgi:hypothetical protein
MRCKRIRDLLSPYIDKMTDEQETQAVEAHLKLCARCREELRQLESLCHMIHELKTPPLMDNALGDLHQRLLEEQLREKPALIAVRRKPKWLAAAAAGLIMAISIYAGGLMPGANLALWFNQDEKEHKPSVAIEEPGPVWENPKINHEIDDPIHIAQQEEDPKSPVDDERQEEEGSSSQPNTNDDTPEVPSSNVEPDPGQVISPRVAQTCSTRIRVQDTGDSLARIVQIADASNGIEFVSTSNHAQIMSSTSTREAVFKVHKNQLDSFLKELENLGNLSTPIYGQLVLTQEFRQLESKISGLEQNLKNLESKNNLSTEDQSKLSSIRQELDDSRSKKAQLEKELDTVSITVYLVQNL